VIVTRAVRVIVGDRFYDTDQVRELLADTGVDVVEGQEPWEGEDVVGLLVGTETEVRTRELDRLPALRVLATCSVGFDHLDVREAERRGVWVCNVPDYCVEEVASHAAALILGGWRKLDRSRRLIDDGRWEDWTALQPMRPLSECTLGLVGVGRIGAEVVRMCSPFFGRIIAFDPAGSPPGVEPVQLDELFTSADVVSLHCPLNPATANIVDEARLASMKPDSLLVNVSRGGLVDPVALARALLGGRPGRAALDVLPKEPPEPDDPLLEAPNLMLTNHVAWLSDVSIGRLRSLVAGRCAAFLTGQPVETVVNAEALRGLAPR
jgi:D-3-phosphoglycerate dehydrogenase